MDYQTDPVLDNLTERLAVWGFSFLVACIFLFFNMGVGGVGLTALYLAMLLYISLALVVTGRVCLHFNRRLHITAALLVLWNLSYFWSFSRSAPLNGEDIAYIVQGMANAVWLYLFAIVASGARRFFWDTMRLTFMLYLFMSMLILLYLMIIYHDPFVLRDEKLLSGWLNMTAFRNPNVMARNCFLMLIITAFLLRCQVPLPTGHGRCLRLLMFGFSLIILLTLSRTNILGLMVFWTLYLSQRKPFYWFLGVLLLMASIASMSLLLPPVWEKVENAATIIEQTLTEDEPSKLISRRARQWIAAAEIIVQNPLYGVGFSQADEVMAEMGSVKDTGDGVVSVHGGFLKVMVYGGAFSFGFFLLFYGYMWRTAVNLYRRGEGVFQREAGYQLRVMLLLLALMNVAGDNFGLAYTWVMVAVLHVFGLAYPPDYVPAMACCDPARSEEQ